jgi:hypothetical protein
LCELPRTQDHAPVTRLATLDEYFLASGRLKDVHLEVQISGPLERR